MSKIKTWLVDSLKNNIYFFIVSFVAIATRIPFVTMQQRWDSGEYYFRFSKAVSEFTFSSFDEYQSLFCLCDHPTMMFSLFYLPGELCFPKQIIGVSITSLLITFATLWCLYKIILSFFDDISRKNAALIVLMISFAPLFYGTTTYFNPDYFLGCMLIIVIFSYIYNRPILAFIASLSCVQSKETGIVVLFGIVVGRFVQHIFYNKGKEKFFSIVKDSCLYTTLVSVLLQLKYMRNIGGVSNWTQTGEETAGIHWDSNGYNCLGINYDHIITKFKQQFLLNFNWLLVLAILVMAIIIFILNRKSEEKIKTNGYIHMIIGGLVAFFIFSCMYITAPMARYNVCGDLFLYLCFVYCLIKLVKLYDCKKVLIIGCTAVTMLLAVQCFFTIDPITRIYFRKLDMGNALMCHVGSLDVPDDELVYGDYLIYNSQYSYIDRAYDKILAKVGYDTSWDILESNSNGNGMTGNFYLLEYDKLKKRRVFYQNENTSTMKYFKEATLVEVEINDKDKVFSDKALLLMNPYYKNINEENMIQNISKYYNIVDMGVQKEINGSINYYVLEKKRGV